jgi:F-type H+-transporting ATPase subunit epsilon
MAFRCVVVTPEQETLNETISQAILPAHDGMIGILTGRAPLLVKLGKGPLRIDLATGQSRTYQINGGIAQMKGDNLTVLTTQANENGAGS